MEAVKGVSERATLSIVSGLAKSFETIQTLLRAKSFEVSMLKSSTIN